MVAAVAFAHSYANPSHETRAKEILLECGFERVSLSSELAPFTGYLARAQTACVNAYLSPVMDAFVSAVAAPAGVGHHLMLMTSAGGLEPAAGFRPKDGLLSGPAGGVVGASSAAAALGFDRVLTLDMGGTSTDVARFDGEFAYRFDHEVGGSRLLTRAMRIETVAAGGGSVCSLAPRGSRSGRKARVLTPDRPATGTADH